MVIGWIYDGLEVYSVSVVFLCCNQLPPPSVVTTAGWESGEIEVPIAFHAVESQGVGGSLQRDELARDLPDVSIFARAAKLRLLGPHGSYRSARFG